MIDRRAIELSERDDPGVRLLAMSGRGASEQIARFHDVFGGRAEPSHLTLDARRRRRAFLDCAADGMPAGWGVDDGAALVFEGPS